VIRHGQQKITFHVISRGKQGAGHTLFPIRIIHYLDFDP